MDVLRCHGVARRAGGRPAGLSEQADPGDRGSGPGGISDIFIRILGDELAKRWGQPLIVENRAGGAFNIGARACAEAAPDGYTICILPNEPMTYNKHLFKNLAYDLDTQIAPVTNLFFMTQALVINSELNVKSVDELVAHAKANPKTLNYTAPAAALVLFIETSTASTASTWCGCRSAAAAKASTACCPACRRSPSSASAISCRISAPAPSTG